MASNKNLGISKKQPKVAIVIVNWEQSTLTINCVYSILDNNYKNFKVFLVDNCSKDGSFERFKREFENNKKVIILRTKNNSGYGGGNNYGAKAATAKYLPDYFCILNNDTVVAKDFLESLVAATESLGRDNIYFPLIFYWQSNRILTAGSRDYLPTPSQFYLKNKDYFKISKVEEMPFLNGCCFLVSRELYNQLGGFDESFFMYAEDIDFGIKAQREGSRLYLIPNSKIWHKGALSFSPLSAYYSTRNSFYIAKGHCAKFGEYLRAGLLFTILAIIHLFKLKPQITLAFVAGFVAFLKREYGKSLFFERPTHNLRATITK